MLTVLVTGSRDWKDGRTIVKRLLECPDGTTIIEGGASGADAIARHGATALGFKVMTVRANWSLGRSAGPVRNRQMLDMKPDLVLAYRLHMSRGTTDCIEEAIKRGIPYELVDG
jgi:YspA, cpYpsA-related SLOG family